jgi:hypothetical protein
MATSGDRYLATSGDFFMATDSERRYLPGGGQSPLVLTA